MAVLNQFDPPAKLNDFPNDPQLAEEFTELWNNNVNGWTQQAITGNPWNALNTSNQTFYFNPLVTDIASAQQARIAWIAFPNRINFYLSTFSSSQLLEIADNGVLSGVRVKCCGKRFSASLLCASFLLMRPVMFECLQSRAS